jgi:hypothetical protein
MTTIVYSGNPINVCIEASFDAIMACDLDANEGEQFDWVKNCIAIERDCESTVFTTVRSWEAWRAGEPNAGRYVLTLPNKMLERIIFPNKETS